MDGVRYQRTVDQFHLSVYCLNVHTSSSEVSPNYAVTPFACGVVIGEMSLT